MNTTLLFYGVAAIIALMLIKFIGLCGLFLCVADVFTLSAAVKCGFESKKQPLFPSELIFYYNFPANL